MLFRTRLFVSMTTVVVFLVVVAVIVVGNKFRNNAIEQITSELQNEHRTVDRFQQLTISSLISLAVNISQDSRLRGSIATGDRATITQAVEDISKNYPSDLLWVLSPQGTVITRNGRPVLQQEVLDNVAVVHDAISGYDSGDIWMVNGHLYNIAAVPIRGGNVPIAILVMGQEFEHGFVDRFSELTGKQLAFVENGHIFACSNPDADRVKLHDAVKEMFSNHRIPTQPLPNLPVDPANKDKKYQSSIIFKLASEEYVGEIFTLSDISGKMLSYGLVYSSLQPALRQLRKIQQALLLIGILAVLVSILASFITARQVTGPIERLVQLSSKLGQGAMETEIKSERNDEIGRLASALNEMRVSLLQARANLIQNERLSTIGKMASSIIHDFKQPITAVYGYIDLMALPATTLENRKQFRDNIFQQIDRMIGMINELLDFAKGDSRLNKRPIMLSAFVNTLKAPFENECKTKQISLKEELVWDGKVNIDAGRVQRGLENIIRNAVQVLPSGGEITITAENRQNNVRISIHDNGPGIPDEIRDKIFDPFVTFGKKEGTGLGLAVAHKVVTEHGGTITVESQSGNGTTFTIELPIEPELGGNA